MMATKVLPAIVRKLSGATTVLAEPASSMGIGPVALTDAQLEQVAGGGGHAGGVADSPSIQPAAVSIGGPA